MAPEIQNPLSRDKLDALEDELLAAVEDEYTAKDFRLVSGMLVPHFRAVLKNTIDTIHDQHNYGPDHPLPPQAIGEFCGGVDQIFVTHAQLLDVKGLFRPVIAAMRPIRRKVRAQLNEEFYAHCRDILAKKKLHDRTALLYRGTMCFIKADFSPLGNARAFATQVLGKFIPFITSQTLGEIADRLNLPLHSEEQAKVYREALAPHGIVDRETLVHATRSDLGKMILPPWGHMLAFFSEILGEPTKKSTIAVRHRIADRLGFPKLSPEEQKAAYRAALAAGGIDDRSTLYSTGIVPFIKKDFPPHGKGTGFAARVLGEKRLRMSRDLLVRIADVLDLPLVSETRKQEYLAALVKHGVRDRLTLIQMGSEKFEAAKFKGFGKGEAFAARVLGKSPRWISHAVLEELADALGFPPLTPEILQQSYRDALRNRGITDRASLLKNGPIWFQHTTFPPWGMGFNLASKILGRSVRPTIALLHEIANVFGL